ncbi:alcohol dehydrogenase catalytic domain-containing protein [Rhodanobacter sp. 7MK24]|uniref:quinone oxidoreductase family protein n=1 Tax=Rhodanobacter sp. 7MK24 TaxID=2775922 RepID=UPI00177D54FD|nr:alcohol dehydrogenase catalytic domain-containing protein [Rhodanobacter sp. 7MK24]MBD8879576.1 alcohol dehydrogenase catalytic domain-containing protein [Rhodanobacter sp. 7MK24]
MLALVFDRVGEPREVLRLADVPPPQLGPRDVLIAVRARVIQPADSMFIAGRYRVKPAFPQVAGFDAAGVVESTGVEVSHVRVGQRVGFRYPGAWADFAVAPAARVYPVPDDLSAQLDDGVVCQFGLNPLTAWGLLDVARLPRGARVLVTAGRSVVAGLLGHLAQQSGLVAERLVRAGDSHSLLDASGTQMLAQADDVARALAAVAPYDAVLDAVGGLGVPALIAATVPGGRLVSYGVLDDRPFEMHAATMVYRNLSWQGFGIDGWLNQCEATTLARAQRECWELLSRHPELVPIAARYPMRDFDAALAAASAGKGGKVLLV